MNILLIARISERKKFLDGVTVKAKILKEYLECQDSLNVSTVDVDDWKKRFFNIAFDIIKNYKKSDKIVICSSSNGAYIVLKFLKFINCKKDIFYFVSGGLLADNIKKGRFKLKFYKDIKKIYVESQDMLEKMNSLGLDNVEKIYNFRKANYYQNKYQKSDITKFVFYGRVVKEKGIEYAIDLIKRLTKNKYKVSLDIFGQVDFVYLQEIQNKIKDCENINYCGVIKPNNSIEYETLSKYDVFIFPTEHIGEGLPGALIDAYFSGLAVLVSNWKYAKEYVQDKKNGYIFEYKNYEDMYNKAELMINSKMIEAFKAKSLELSNNYNVEYVLTDFLENLKNENN